MKRKIIKIDKDKCIGCKLCITACHENAIALVNGKATLIRDDYCDGLGNCLPVCPTNAISFEIREGLEYNINEVIKHKEEITCGTCSWPVQLALVSINAPFLKNCELLIAADCTAFAYRDFHRQFVENKITLIGCPKLDSHDYTKKLSEIIIFNEIKKITVVKMEVPCCSRLVSIVDEAIKNSELDVCLEISTVSIKGSVL